MKTFFGVCARRAPLIGLNLCVWSPVLLIHLLSLHDSESGQKGDPTFSISRATTNDYVPLLSNLQIVFLIRSENCEKYPSQFLRDKGVKSSNRCVCPQLKIFSFKISYKGEKKHIVTLKKPEPSHVWHICLRCQGVKV